MAYNKYTWHTGEVITEGKLNHMEKGIADNDSAISSLRSDLAELSSGLNPESQKTGNIITLDSNSSIIKKITVGAPSGISSSVITRCGRNIYPKYTQGSVNGLSWTVASDGTLTFNGTPSADVLLRLQGLYIPVTGVPLTFAFFNNMADSRLSFFGITPENINNYQVNLTVHNTVASGTPTKDFVELRLRIPKDIDWTGLLIKPMMVVGNTAGNFEEYTGETFDVTLIDGVVQENIPLLTGVNTLFASNGELTVDIEVRVSIVEYVTGKFDKALDSFYRFEKSGTASYLYIYYKSGDKYVRWELHNVPAPSSNSDTWQIGRICGVNNIDDSGLVEIVRGGEFELAFKENGAADYCGGNNHGDENTDVFKLFIDGKQISDLTALDTDLHPFTRIDAFEIATVNRCDTPSEDILKHQKIWNFEGGKVTVRQTIKFLEQLVVDTALVCMFAALRSAFPYGIRKGGVAVEDMSTSDYSKTYTTSDDVFYEYYGISATAKIHASTDNPENKSVVWINNTLDLNKLYYGYYGVTDSGNPTTVPIDTIITSMSEYDVAYTPA